MMEYTAAVITVSDKGSRGEREDTSGPALAGLLTQAGYQVVERVIIPRRPGTDSPGIASVQRRAGDRPGVDHRGDRFLSPGCDPGGHPIGAGTGGPGHSRGHALCQPPNYPQGLSVPGVASLRGGTLIVNLPGSRKAAVENLEAVLPALGHGLDVLRGSSGDCGVEGHG